MKLYKQILDPDLDRTDTEQSQSGFRKGHSLQDHISTLKSVTHKILASNRKTYVAFLDLEKTSDSVPRGKVWNM